MEHHSWISILICLLIFLISQVLSHGRLTDPPSRSSMWRYGFQNPPNYNDMELFCGGFTRQWKRNGGKCGICGDAFDASDPKPHEAGGKYANGIIVRSYVKGQLIRASVELTANHNGHFEFRVCPTTNSKKEVTQDCLDKHILWLEDGSGTKFHVPKGSGNGMFHVNLQLPQHLACKHCVFQWIYKAANNWGQCPDGTGKVGCGPQEQFRACADIEIKNEQQQHQFHHNPGKEDEPSETTRKKTNRRKKINYFYNNKRYRPLTTVAPLVVVDVTTKRQQNTWWPNVVRKRHNQPKQQQQPPLHEDKAERFPTIQKTTHERTCGAVGIWASQPGMTDWCRQNCLHVPPHCPPSHCACVH